MNSVILAFDVKMEVMNRHICVTQNEFQAFSKGCSHRHDREVLSTVRSNAEMVDAVQRRSFVVVAMDAVTTVMKINVAYVVSINQSE